MEKRKIGAGRFVLSNDGLIRLLPKSNKNMCPFIHDISMTELGSTKIGVATFVLNEEKATNFKARKDSVCYHNILSQMQL